MNNNREYRFLTTRYSQLTSKKYVIVHGFQIVHTMFLCDLNEMNNTDTGNRKKFHNILDLHFKRFGDFNNTDNVVRRDYNNFYSVLPICQSICSRMIQFVAYFEYQSNRFDWGNRFAMCLSNFYVFNIDPRWTQFSFLVVRLLFMPHLYQNETYYT